MVAGTPLNVTLYVHSLSLSLYFFLTLPSAPISAAWTLPSRIPDQTVYIQSTTYAVITLQKVRLKLKFVQVVFEHTNDYICMYIHMYVYTRIRESILDQSPTHWNLDRKHREVLRMYY
jgi:hypothetical protein